jgi:hypothetical protein
MSTAAVRLREIDDELISEKERALIADGRGPRWRRRRRKGALLGSATIFQASSPSRKRSAGLKGKPQRSCRSRTRFLRPHSAVSRP